MWATRRCRSVRTTLIPRLGRMPCPIPTSRQTGRLEADEPLEGSSARHPAPRCGRRARDRATAQRPARSGRRCELQRTFCPLGRPSTSSAKRCDCCDRPSRVVTRQRPRVSITILVMSGGLCRRSCARSSASSDSGALRQPMTCFPLARVVATQPSARAVKQKSSRCPGAIFKASAAISTLERPEPSGATIRQSDRDSTINARGCQTALFVLTKKSPSRAKAAETSCASRCALICSMRATGKLCAAMAGPFQTRYPGPESSRAGQIATLRALASIMVRDERQQTERDAEGPRTADHGYKRSAGARAWVGPTKARIAHREKRISDERIEARQQRVAVRSELGVVVAAELVGRAGEGKV